ncbi:MAG: CHAT domain-containing protein [Acidobacteria bacterium]|nr:MAG: CHAT domain-containing protein [Acidobacteriota bacterium]
MRGPAHRSRRAGRKARGGVDRSASGPRGVLRAALALLALVSGAPVCWTAPPESGAGEDGFAAIRALIDQRRFAEARERALEKLRELEEHGLGDTLAAAEVLDLAVDAARRAPAVPSEEDERLARRAIAIKERELGREDAGTALSWHQYGTVLHRRRQLEQARRAYETALGIRERLFGTEALEITPTLVNLGGLLVDLGEREAALGVYERCLAIRERRLQPGDPRLATIHRNIGLLQMELGRTEEAVSHQQEALRIVRAAFGDRHPRTASAYDALSAALLQAGRFDEAIEASRRGIDIAEAAGDGLAAAVARGNLATILMQLGRLADAQDLFERALAYFAAHPDHEPLARAQALNNSGLLLARLGDTSEGRRRIEQALAIRRRSLHPDDPAIAESMIALGHTHWFEGDLESAFRRYGEAARRLEAALGPDHRSLAQALYDQGLAARSMGRRREARRLIERATAIESRYEKDAPSVEAARDHEMLAVLSFELGDDASAAREFERAEEVLRRTVGLDHPAAAGTLHQHAAFLAARGDAAGALELALRAWRSSREGLRAQLGGLPERQALQIALSMRGRSGRDVALGLAAGGRLAPAQIARVWEALIASRALVLDSLIHRRLAEARGSRDARLALLRARRNLAGLIVRGPGSTPAAAYRDAIRRARAEAERAERELARAGGPEPAPVEGITIDAVRAALPPDAALIAWARFDEAGRTGEVRGAYVAFVLPPGKADPIAVPLGDAGRIEELVRRWREEISAPPLAAGRDRHEADARYREAAESLRRAVWDPVVAKAGGARVLFVVPDGALHAVNPATFPAAGGRFWAETGAPVHRLTSERDLLRGAPVRRGRGLLAVGGIDFDAGARAGAPEDVESAMPPSERDSARSRDGCWRLVPARFAPLPGTEREVTDLAERWRASAARRGAPAAVRIVTGAAADEATFRREAPGRRILHLATHSFRIESDCPRTVPAGARGEAPFAPGPVLPVPIDPLFRTGLALAGANRAPIGAGPQGSGRDSAADDGLLTAAEIAALDLTGVEWVVLSACDSGLGEVRTAEGVLGLQRAFFEAGARTAIVSLWPADDSATREWMAALYRARLEEQRPTAEAVAAATREVIAVRRASHRPVHPFYWGAFVAAGDWR